MARKRKMAVWRRIYETIPHSSLTRCSLLAHGFGPHLLYVVDPWGCFSASPRAVFNALFLEREDVKESQVSKWLDEWEGCGFLQRYEVDGRRYLHILKWDDWQPGCSDSRRGCRPTHPLPSWHPDGLHSHRDSTSDSRGIPGDVPVPLRCDHDDSPAGVRGAPEEFPGASTELRSHEESERRGENEKSESDGIRAISWAGPHVRFLPVAEETNGSVMSPPGPTAPPIPNWLLHRGQEFRGDALDDLARRILQQMATYPREEIEDAFRASERTTSRISDLRYVLKVVENNRARRPAMPQGSSGRPCPRPTRDAVRALEERDARMAREAKEAAEQVDAWIAELSAADRDQLRQEALSQTPEACRRIPGTVIGAERRIASAWMGDGLRR